MPGSTTLESLNIEINANSQKASEGISNLIGSLRSLAKAVGTVTPAMRSLNTEIKALSKTNVGNIAKILNPSASSASGMRSTAKSMMEVAKAAKEISNAKPPERLMSEVREMYGPNPIGRIFNPKTGNFDALQRQTVAVHNTKAADALKNLSSAPAAEGIKQTTESLQEAAPAANQATEALKEVDEELKQKKTDGEQARAGMREATSGIQEASREAERSAPRFQRLFNSFQRIGRMFTTMVLRTAIRSLIKAFGESWEAAYNFSANMGGSFAKSIDAARTMLADTATTAIQTFAPIIQALIPVVNVLAGAIQYLCQGLQYLLNLLGLTSDLLGHTASQINKGIGGSGSGSSKKNKNKGTLADWDELNIIQSQTDAIGGGGSGSSYKPGSIAALVNEEIQAIMSVIVGEALLAVGLILCFTGHIPAGIGLMLLGAAAIAKPVFTDWDKLPTNVKETIAKVTVIASGAFFALGMVLAATGHIGLGIGMMALGAANFAIFQKIAWGDGLEGNLKATIAKIEVIVWDSLMVIGLILCFTGHIPAGIGLMLLGVAAIAKPVFTDWDKLPTNVQETIAKITVIASGAFFALGMVLAATGHIGLGIGMMALGAANFAISQKIAWGDGLEGNLKATIAKIEVIVGDSLMVIGAILALTGVGTAIGIAMMVAGAAMHYSGMSLDGEAVTEMIAGVLEKIRRVFEEKFNEIKQKVSDAWDTVKQWFDENISKKIEKAFSGVKEFFEGIFTPLRNAWNWVKDIFGIGNSKKSYEIDVNETRYVTEVFVGVGGAHGFADGAYGIPKGDLFIANEAGAELVGSMNGKTTVANQGQIIDGIRSGVRDANSEQNALLRAQNDLLRALLDKSGNVEVHPSAEWGAFNERSNSMWATATGR